MLQNLLIDENAFKQEFDWEDYVERYYVEKAELAASFLSSHDKTVRRLALEAICTIFEKLFSDSSINLYSARQEPGEWAMRRLLEIMTQNNRMNGPDVIQVAWGSLESEELADMVTERIFGRLNHIVLRHQRAEEERKRMMALSAWLYDPDDYELAVRNHDDDPYIEPYVKHIETLLEECRDRRCEMRDLQFKLLRRF